MCWAAKSETSLHISGACRGQPREEAHVNKVLPMLCCRSSSHISLASHLLTSSSFRSTSLLSCASHLPCHKNELDLSPSVQTTIDRVGDLQENKLPSPVPVGYCCLCVCARVLLMSFRAQMRNRTMPMRHPGSFMNVCVCMCVLNHLGADKWC